MRNRTGSRRRSSSAAASMMCSMSVQRTESSVEEHREVFVRRRTVRSAHLVVGAQPHPPESGRRAERRDEVGDLRVGLEQHTIGRAAARAGRWPSTSEPARLPARTRCAIDDTLLVAGGERVEDQRDAAPGWPRDRPRRCRCARGSRRSRGRSGLEAPAKQRGRTRQEPSDRRGCETISAPARARHLARMVLRGCADRSGRSSRSAARSAGAGHWWSIPGHDELLSPRSRSVNGSPRPAAIVPGRRRPTRNMKRVARFVVWMCVSSSCGS